MRTGFWAASPGFGASALPLQLAPDGDGGFEHRRVGAVSADGALPSALGLALS